MPQLYFCERWLGEEDGWSSHPELITDDLDYARSWILSGLKRFPGASWWHDFHRVYDRIRKGFFEDLFVEVEHEFYRLRPVVVSKLAIGSLATVGDQ
jgi:hypothetical protein